MAIIDRQTLLKRGNNRHLRISYFELNSDFVDEMFRIFEYEIDC